VAQACYHDDEIDEEDRRPTVSLYHRWSFVETNTLGVIRYSIVTYKKAGQSIHSRGSRKHNIDTLATTSTQVSVTARPQASGSSCFCRPRMRPEADPNLTTVLFPPSQLIGLLTFNSLNGVFCARTGMHGASGDNVTLRFH
jgi:hypothetical protein